MLATTPPEAYGAVSRAPVPETTHAATYVRTSVPAVQRGIFRSKLRKELPRPREQGNRPNKHVRQCLNRHVFDDAANGVVDADKGIERHGVVSHGVNCDPDR